MIYNPVNRSIWFARLVSRITNPTILAVIMLLLLVFTETNSAAEAMVDIALFFLLFCFIPAIYVFFKASRLHKSTKSLGELTTYLKHHPIDIIILGFFVGFPCVLLLWLIKAPDGLIAAVTALLAGALVTALVNLFYRASFHLCGVTVLIIIAAYSWSNLFLLLFIMVPLIAWSKYKIGDHTVIQLILGLVIGLTIGIMTLSTVR